MKTYIIKATDNQYANLNALLETGDNDLPEVEAFDYDNLADFIFRLAETVADIAYTAGNHKYYSGDSRQDVYDFIVWATQFEKIWQGHEWGIDEGPDYIEAINEFTYIKIETIKNKQT